MFDRMFRLTYANVLLIVIDENRILMIDITSDTNDPEDGDGQPLTLVIGDHRAWNEIESRPPEIAGFKFIDIDDLDASIFEDFPATIVLSSLMSRGHDAIEIARILSDLSFKGSYRVIATGLPNPDLVTQEVKASVPEIDFEVLNLPTFDLFG